MESVISKIPASVSNKGTVRMRFHSASVRRMASESKVMLRPLASAVSWPASDQRCSEMELVRRR